MPVSVVRAESDEMRIDSAFFLTKPVAELVRSRNGEDFLSISNWITQGPNPLFVERGIPCFTGRNVKTGILVELDADQVDEGTFDTYARFALKRSDLLITLKGAGSTGKVALVEESLKAMFSRNLGLIRLNKGNIHRAPFIYAFLSSAIGQTLIDRGVTGGTGQLTLPTTYLKSMPVPRFGDQFEQRIAKLIEQASALQRQSELSLSKAKQVLLEELGLTNWTPPDPLTYNRRAKDVFAAERIDAEHFREKFFAAKRVLNKAGASEWIPLSELVTLLTNGHTPLRHDLTQGEVPFLCAEHISDFEIEYASDKMILAEHHTGELARTAVRNGDVLLTIKGKVGNAAIVENVPGAMNINQDVALLRLNNRLPKWWVVTFLNSFFGKLFSEQYSTGAINPFLGLFSVRQIEIPRFPDERTTSPPY